MVLVEEKKLQTKQDACQMPAGRLPNAYRMTAGRLLDDCQMPTGRLPENDGQLEKKDKLEELKLCCNVCFKKTVTIHSSDTVLWIVKVFFETDVKYISLTVQFHRCLSLTYIRTCKAFI